MCFDSNKLKIHHIGCKHLKNKNKIKILIFIVWNHMHQNHTNLNFNIDILANQLCSLTSLDGAQKVYTFLKKLHCTSVEEVLWLMYVCKSCHSAASNPALLKPILQREWMLSLRASGPWQRFLFDYQYFIR